MLKLHNNKKVQVKVQVQLQVQLQVQVHSYELVPSVGPYLPAFSRLDY